MLLTHLYEYFGVLLGCSMQGTEAYPAYGGGGSQYEIHKFMDLSAAEFGYFVNQVAMSAASFGVATADLTIVGNALYSTFGMMMSAPAIVVPAQGAQLQAICIGDGCPEAKNATTSGYAAAVEPSTAISSLVPTSTAMVTGTATPAASASAAASSAASAASSASGASGAAGGSSTSTSKAAGATMVVNFAAAVGGLAALLI